MLEWHLVQKYTNSRLGCWEVGPTKQSTDMDDFETIIFNWKSGAAQNSHSAA